MEDRLFLSVTVVALLFRFLSVESVLSKHCCIYVFIQVFTSSMVETLIITIHVQIIYFR
jgi:hypothetical protein